MNHHGRFADGYCSVMLPGMLFVLCFIATGCRTATDFGPPGTMETQQVRALQHDPYPNREIGPEIHSSRPLGFDRPRDQTSQLQSRAPRRGLNFQPPQGF